MKVTVERMTMERENRARNCANVDVLNESDIGATKKGTRGDHGPPIRSKSLIKL